MNNWQEIHGWRKIRAAHKRKTDWRELARGLAVALGWAVIGGILGWLMGRAY